jgi:hypothetical protein
MEIIPRQSCSVPCGPVRSILPGTVALYPSIIGGSRTLNGRSRRRPPLRFEDRCFRLGRALRTYGSAQAAPQQTIHRRLQVVVVVGAGLSLHDALARRAGEKSFRWLVKPAGFCCQSWFYRKTRMVFMPIPCAGPSSLSLSRGSQVVASNISS